MVWCFCHLVKVVFGAHSAHAFSGRAHDDDVAVVDGGEHEDAHDRLDDEAHLEGIVFSRNSKDTLNGNFYEMLDKTG